MLNLNTVDETQVNGVDGYFRIKDGLQVFLDLFDACGFLVGIRSFGCVVAVGFPERIGILGGYSVHALKSHDGEVSSKAMGNGDFFSPGQIEFLAMRNQGRRDARVSSISSWLVDMS